MSFVHLCSFSVGIDELPQRKQRDAAEVLKILAQTKRFSVFEATANNVIAKTMTRMQGHYFKVVGGGYPWCEIELTEAGKKLLLEGSERLYKEGDTVTVQQLINNLQRLSKPRRRKHEGRLNFSRRRGVCQFKVCVN